MIHVVKGFREAVEIERQVLKGFIALPQALKVVDLLDEYRDEIAKTLRLLGWRFIVDRKLIAYLGPENLTKGLPRSYFELVNGSLYVKVPLVIMVNNASRGASMSGFTIVSGDVTRLLFYPVMTSGDVVPSLRRGITPRIGVWRGS